MTFSLIQTSCHLICKNLPNFKSFRYKHVKTYCKANLWFSFYSKYVFVPYNPKYMNLNICRWRRFVQASHPSSRLIPTAKSCCTCTRKTDPDFWPTFSSTACSPLSFTTSARIPTSSPGILLESFLFTSGKNSNNA